MTGAHGWVLYLNEGLMARVGSYFRAFGVGALVAGACTIAVVANTAAAPDDNVVAVIYSPWRDPADAFSRTAAAAPVMGQGAAPFILLSRPRSDAERQALGRSGAWFVLDGSLARWCGSASGDDDVA